MEFLIIDIKLRSKENTKNNDSSDNLKPEDSRVGEEKDTKEQMCWIIETKLGSQREI